MRKIQSHFDHLEIMSAWKFTQTTDCSQRGLVQQVGAARVELQRRGRWAVLGNSVREVLHRGADSEGALGGEVLMTELGLGRHRIQGKREF